jgi:putative ABC transport system permease protein
VEFGGRPHSRPGETADAMVRTVMPRYFETMGIPLRRGRDFTVRDNTPEAPMRFVVSEAFVRKYMANEDPLGRTLSVEMDYTNPFGEIIGVVGDVDEGSVGKEALPTVYYVHAHLPYTAMTLLVRAEGDPLGFVGPVRKIMREIDPLQPVAEVRTMEAVLAETYGREHFSAILFGGFSLVALLLAAIGIYSVLAYSVAERTREIGVRMAVGADAGRIVLMVLRDGARFVLAGLAMGMLGAMVLSRYLEGLLFQVGARDPIAFLTTPGVLLAVALVAAYVPARRAARLDPMKALRAD